MSWAEHLKAIGPFIAAVALVVLSPLLDEIVWRSTYHRFYREDLDQPEARVTNLETSAGWVVDMTQLYTGVLLAWTGLLLALPKVGVLLTIASMIIVLAPMLWAAHHSRQRQLHILRTIWKLPYTGPQVTIVVTNALCAWLVWSHVTNNG